MILHTKRLILRPWEESDANDLYEYAKDPHVGPIAGWPVHTSVENSREIIKNVLSADETYAVCLKDDNKAIGSIGLMIGKKSRLDLPETEGEIGFWLGVPFWGQGLIPEAASELIRHAFCDLQLEKLWCRYFDGNEKSKRAQAKCGFSYHHTNKSVYKELIDATRTEHVNCLERQFVRPLLPNEISDAAELSWDVFCQFEAPEYSEEGIQTFRSYLEDKEALTAMQWFGAFENGVLIGTLAVREKQHISLFFVRSEYQGKGYGKQLFAQMKAAFTGNNITVNAARYAVPIYQCLGFMPTDSEQLKNGIRFTPMIFRAQQGNTDAKLIEKLSHFYEESGLLKQYPSKRPLRKIVLQRIADMLEKGKEYTEKEINTVILSNISFSDVELIRRELIDSGLLSRTRNGAKYWRSKESV